MLTVPLLAALALLIASAGPAAAQNYEAIYGPIQDVSLDDLIDSDVIYDGRGVRVRARLNLYNIPGTTAYTLSEGLLRSVLLIPVPELENQFEFEAREYVGRQVEVEGVFSASGGTGIQQGGPRGRVTFWSFVGPPADRDEDIKASDVSLESLVRAPGQRDGQMVRVIGQFRGRNLFRDLPSSSQRRSADWVIKDDIFAVWITGRQPRGDGFRLDPGLKRDTGKWLEVTGRVRTRRGTTYIDAVAIRLSDRPLRASAGAAPTPTPVPRAPTPPVVVFSLPLDGEVIPTATVFKIQFSKDMAEESFAGRVVVRYAGPRRPGDRLFDGLRLAYDGGLRTLSIDPGDVLRTGRDVRVLLLKGIQDLQGLPLQAHAEDPALEAEIADELHYRVESEFGGGGS